MDALKAWKLQRGKGTFVYDNDDSKHIDIVETLVSSIYKLNTNIIGICGRSDLEYLNNNIIDKFVSYETAIVTREPVFLLVILDIHSLPEDIFNIIMKCVPHKYLFCTSRTNDLNKYHLKVSPIIKFEVTKKQLGITSSERKIYNVGLDLLSEDQLHYDQYTEKMNDIFNYFDGNFDTINNCYIGNKIIGKTADIYRREFSTLMGWTDTLNTDIEYYNQIDKFFNPNYIYEQAKLYMDLMSKRNHFIDEHLDKVKYVIRLLCYHHEKRFIVVCKNSEMADAVNRTMNTTNFTYHIRAIHNSLKTVNFSDPDGNVITYKSGAREGQPKEFGSTVQTDTYIDWFNRKMLSTMVISNSPRKGIELDAVDGIIYLSPKCLKYEDLQKRINIRLNSNTNLVNVYFSGTTDEKRLRTNLSGGKHDPKYYNKGDFNKLLFD